MEKNRRVDESTLKMMNHFMEDHNNGMGIPEIAKKYKLSTTTVRKYLGEIAEKAGVTRESLLERVHKPHIFVDRLLDKPVEKISTKDLDEHVKAVRAGISKIQQSVRESIKECKTFDDRFQEVRTNE